MKALIIGGTGTISLAVTKEFLSQKDWEVYVLNRGRHNDELPLGVKTIICDVNDEKLVKSKISRLNFDVVADFIAFKPEDVKRDIRLFTDKTEQFIFISSASVYEKPPESVYVKESTKLLNPFWKYSQDKIKCEEVLLQEFKEREFPVTVVRPAHTYGKKSIPLSIHGKNGSFQNIYRMLIGKPIIVPGDGTSLWSLTYNEDFARAFVKICANPKTIGQAIHIISDEVLCWNQIYSIAASSFGVKANIVHIATDFLISWDEAQYGCLLGDKSNSVIYDNSKLKSILPGFEFNVDFKTGCKIAADYILSHEESQIIDPDFDEWCDSVIAKNLAGRGPRRTPA